MFWSNSKTANRLWKSICKLHIYYKTSVQNFKSKQTLVIVIIVSKQNLVWRQKKFKRHFTKDKWMTNKHMKNTWETQVETTMRYHNTPTRMAKMSKTSNTESQRGGRTTRNHCGNVKCSSHVGNSCAAPYKVKHKCAIELSRPAYTYFWKINKSICLCKTCMKMFIEALFIITQMETNSYLPAWLIG